MIFFVYPLMVLNAKKSSIYFFSFMECSGGVLVLIMLVAMIFFILSLLKFHKLNLGGFSFVSIAEGLTIMSMSLNFISDNFLSFLIYFEMSMIPMVYMVMELSYGSDKISSSFFMVIMNMLGSMPSFGAVSVMSQQMGGGSNSTVSSTVLLWATEMEVLFFSLVVLFMVKIPVMFFHFWLPKAHVSASALCSLVLASLMLKMAGMGFLKFGYIFILSASTYCFLLSLGSLSPLFILGYMTRYCDNKNMIALSSILHMSMIPFMCLSKSPQGYGSSLMMIVSHGVVSACLFLISGLFYEMHHNRSSEFSKSSESSDKLISWVYVMMMMINLGVPPFMNFFSEVIMIMTCLINSISSTATLTLTFLLSSILMMLFCSSTLSGKKMNQSYLLSNFSIFVVSIMGALSVLFTTPLIS